MTSGRESFRRCLTLYRECAGTKYLPAVEYRIDFERCCESQCDPTWRGLFRLHLIEGRPWRDVAPRLGLDRSNFFAQVYQMEESLGHGLIGAGLCRTSPLSL